MRAEMNWHIVSALTPQRFRGVVTLHKCRQSAGNSEMHRRDASLRQPVCTSKGTEASVSVALGIGTGWASAGQVLGQIFG